MNTPQQAVSRKRLILWLGPLLGVVAACGFWLWKSLTPLPDPVASAQQQAARAAKP